ncbi:DUF2073 domain-containing protein [Candidatus Aenigmatarchaeota archaeon]
MNIKIKLLPYERFKRDKYKAVLKELKDNTIILIDAKLSMEEELTLIKETMRNITGTFTGIELSSINSIEKTMTNTDKFRNMLVERIIGKKRGMTIIGPARLVQKIKKNPEEIELYV